MINKKEKNNKSIFGDYNPTILYGILLLVVGIIVMGVVKPKEFAEMTGKSTSLIIDNVGFALTISIVIFVVFCIWIAISKYGELILGKEGDKPEYSFFTWFCMLFSCGLGVALYFWGVGEPLTHYMNPPYLAEPETIESASLALQITNMHYGITMWAAFATVGLIISYFTYRKGKPLTLSSCFYGVLGEKSYGKFGTVIDFLTVLATVGGVSTSVGMGVLQLRYCVTWLTGIDVSNTMVSGIFIILLILYTVTAASGINKGIKYLSNFNMYIAFGLLTFVFIFGPTVFQVELMVQSIGEMVVNFPKMVSFLDPSDSTNGWTKSWSVFYWCWHMSWAPFVGGFVARISKGRTIREFIIGVLGAPIIFTFVWFTIFGGSAIFNQMNGVDIWSTMSIDTTAGIFALFETLPISKILGVILFINLLTFLATSANSAALYSSVIVSKGSQNPKTPMIILWSLAIGMVGLILMLTGGLQALQSAAVASGFIFSIIMVVMIISMMKELKKEKI